MKKITFLIYFTFLFVCQLFAQQKLYGLYSKDGKMLLPGSFSKIRIIDNYFFVDKNGELEIYKYNGVKTVRLPYRDIRHFFKNIPSTSTVYTYDNICLFDYKKRQPFENQRPKPENTKKRIIFNSIKDNRFGFIDTLGNEITPVKYDNVYHEKDGLFLVEANKKWGFVNIDAPNPEIIPCQYVYYSPKDIDIQGNYISMEKENFKGVVYDINGKIIIPETGWLIPLNEGFWAVCDSASYAEWGVVNSKGKEIVKRIYHRIEKDTIPDLWRMRIDNEYFISDTLGNIIPMQDYEKICRNQQEKEPFPKIEFSNRQFQIIPHPDIDKKQKREKYYYLNRNYMDNAGIYFAQKNRYKWDMYDSQGIKLKSVKFERIKEYSNGYFIIQRNYRYGVIDKYGNEILPILFNEIIADEGYFIAWRAKTNTGDPHAIRLF